MIYIVLLSLLISILFSGCGTSVSLNNSTDVCTYRTGKSSDNCYLLSLSKCSRNSDWTIHGLWPEWGNNCGDVPFVNGCHDRQFSITSDLEEQMTEVYPSCPKYYHCKNNGYLSTKWLWGHEWYKHGTCSGMSQQEYFSSAVKLRNDYKHLCPNKSNTCNICFSKDLKTVLKCA